MRSWPFLALLSLTLLVGCRSDSKKPPDADPSPYLTQTSIPNVLANLTLAYTKMNYEEYQKLLDSSYEYIFAPQDIGGENNIPASWGRADELVSAEHMFNGSANRDGYRAEEILLTFTAGADTPTELNPDWRKVVLSNVNLIDSRQARDYVRSPDLPGDGGQGGALLPPDGRDGSRDRTFASGRSSGGRTSRSASESRKQRT